VSKNIWTLRALSALALACFTLAPNLVPAQAAAQSATRLVCYEFPCRFESTGWTITIAPNGSTSGRTTPSRVRSLRLPIPPRFEITRVLAEAIDSDVLIAYEIEDGEVGAARIVRLDGRSLTRRWVVDVKSFNLSEGVVEGRFLYQAAFAMVMKIDLRRGRIVWKHEGLYDAVTQSFNAFNQPLIGSENVEFVEERVSNGAPRKVTVNKQTGAMRIE
jgi:hypothetical protein